MHDQTHTTACPECDLLLSFSENLTIHSLRCPKCSCLVHKRIRDWLEKTLILSTTGLLFYLPALLLPLMTLETLGMTDSGNVLDTLLVFYKNGYFVVAFVILFSAVFLSLLLLSLIFTITLSLNLHRYPALLLKLFRLYIFLEEWAMVEINLLGIMVTKMKMRHTADIHFNPGFFCFPALVLISMGITTVLDKEQIWFAIASKGGRAPTPAGGPAVAPENERTTHPQTALGSGLALCHVCRRLQPLPAGTSESSAPCSRCGSRIHSRKPASISRTSALILTSALLLIPANILSIMQVRFLGLPEYSTIVDGITFFFEEGSFFIGLIILTASVFVPIFKIIGLLLPLYSKEEFSCKPRNS